jgi:hypothetical protein
MLPFNKGLLSGVITVILVELIVILALFLLEYFLRRSIILPKNKVPTSRKTFVIRPSEQSESMDKYV